MAPLLAVVCPCAPEFVLSVFVCGGLDDSCVRARRVVCTEGCVHGGVGVAAEGPLLAALCRTPPGLPLCTCGLHRRLFPVQPHVDAVL